MIEPTAGAGVIQPVPGRAMVVQPAEPTTGMVSAAPAESAARAALGPGPPVNARRDLFLLALAGLALLGLYGSLVARFPLLHYFPGPGFTISFYEIFGANWVQGAWWYVGVFSGAFLLLGAAVLLAPRRPTRAGLAVVAGFPTLFAGALLYMYPATAIDVIHYYAAARTLWIYHENPMVVPVDAHPFIVAISFHERPSPYGPLWQVLTGPTTFLAGDHWTWGLLGMKLVAVIAYFACMGLIYLTVRRLQPDRALLAMILFAWNPFVTFRAVGNAHNDTVMVALILLAIYCLVSERWLWVFPALAAAVLVKYVPLMLGPVFAIYLVQLAQQRRDGGIIVRSLVGAAGAAIVSATLIALFWDQAAFLQSAGQAFEAITSTPLVLATWLESRGAAGDQLPVARTALQFGFAAFYVVILATTRPRPQRLISCSILIFFSYLVIAAVWFRPWYFLWFMPLTVLQPGRWYVAFGLLASYCVNFVELVEIYRLQMQWLIPHDVAFIAAPVAVQFVLPSLLLLFALVITRSPDLQRGTRARSGAAVGLP